MPDNRAGAGDLGYSQAMPVVENETKPSYRTTEFFVYLAGVLAIILTALIVDGGGGGGDDPFNAEQALRYITFLTIGYMLSRGLAKSGSRNPNRYGH